MISFSHHKLFLLPAAIVLISLGVSSCTKTEPWTWERDYYTYQKGARINGVEYHEKYDWDSWQFWFGGKSIYCGFSLKGGDGIVMLMNNESWCYQSWWSGQKGKDTYEMSYIICADSSSFKPGETFHFATSDEIVVWGETQNIERDKLPIVKGHVSTIEDSKEYVITDGYISFGDFVLHKYSNRYSGQNLDRVIFSFSAISNDGETLQVEDGYYNRYTYDYYVDYSK